MLTVFFEGNNYFGYPITFYVNFNDIGDIDHLIIQGKKYQIKWDGIKGFVNKQFILIFSKQLCSKHIKINV